VPKILKLPVLPPMQCDDDCGDCCGPLFVPEADYQRIRRIVRERKIVTETDPYRCPFYQKGKCAIYDERPGVCRAFGHVETLSCPRGYNVNVEPGPVRAALVSRGVHVRLLHEIAAEQHPGKVDLNAIKDFIPQGESHVSRHVPYRKPT